MIKLVISKFTNDSVSKASGSSRSKIHRMINSPWQFKISIIRRTITCIMQHQLLVKEMARIKVVLRKIGKILKDLDQGETEDQIQVTVDVDVNNFVLKDEWMHEEGDKEGSSSWWDLGLVGSRRLWVSRHGIV